MRAPVSKRMRIFGALIGLVVAAVIGGATSLDAHAVLPALPNTVQQWNKIAEDTVVGSGAFQGEGEIYMSYESLAVYDAVVAIQGALRDAGRLLILAPILAVVGFTLVQVSHLIPIAMAYELVPETSTRRARPGTRSRLRRTCSRSLHSC